MMQKLSYYMEEGGTEVGTDELMSMQHDPAPGHSTPAHQPVGDRVSVRPV